MTEHLPHLPARGELTSRDRICSAALPCAGDRRGIKRVFHEAGPVAYTAGRHGHVTVPMVCIHGGRDFSRAGNTDKTLTGAA